MSFSKKTIRDVPLGDKTVLMRADFNVPINEAGDISDDSRIVKTLPSINFLRRAGCKVVICSHLGRPEGKPNPKYSLEPAAQRLAQHLQCNVTFVDSCVGDRVAQAVKHAKAGSVVVLENLRFHPEEEANDHQFAKAIATSAGASYFVQDGFGVVHRAHASTEAITHYLPSVAGLLLELEVRTLKRVMSHPKKPLTAILGGAKVSDKISVVERFIEIADHVVIGGAMANNFLKYRGYQVGTSKLENNVEATIKKAYDNAAQRVGDAHIDDFLLLPVDVAIAKAIDGTQQRTIVDASNVPHDQQILDIGPKTIEKLAEVIGKSSTVVWSGTLGYAELSNFAHGSARAAMAMATTPGLTSIVGGGDTADFAVHWDSRGGASFTHISTGGSASLELMAGEKLPGVEALLNA